MLLFASYGRKEAYVTRKLPIILPIKEEKKQRKKKLFNYQIPIKQSLKNKEK